MGYIRLCTCCKKELPETIEYFHRRGPDKFASKCKICRNAQGKEFREKSDYGREYYQKNREILLEDMRQKYKTKHPMPELPEGFKRCCKCNEIKPATEEYFNRLKKAKDGFRFECKECKKKEYESYKNIALENNKRRYTLKKDAILLNCKKYRESHKEQIRNFLKEYYKDNMKKIKESAKRSMYRRIEEDSGYKILVRYRTRLYKALKGISKSKCTKDLIGCSIEELKVYLENQFKNGMSWDNYGEWHVDHIKPCITFDFTKEEEQKKCFNYTNLQPLWACDNLKKSARFNEATG